MATFTGKVTGGTLAFRSTPGGSTISGKSPIPDGTTLSVSTISGNTEWFSTTYSSTSGYVMSRWIAITSGGVNTGTVSTSSGSLNIRATPSASGTISFTCAKGATVQILEGPTSGFYRIGCSQGTGWASDAYITVGSGGGSGGGGTGVNTATWAQVKAGSSVYKKESSSSAVCEGVKTLQQFLKSIGYGANNVGNIVVDGNFGSITETAVKYFQTECGLSSDGIVGKDTAIKLESVQSNSYFTNSNYFPLNASLHTYTSYPYTQASLVARIICAEHGYCRNSGDTDARHGVAKVLKNRVDKGGVTLYDNSKPRDYKNVIFGLNGQYTTANSALAYRVARGTTAFTEAVSLATTITGGNTPTGAPNVTTQIFQKGSSQDNATYQAKSSYARYPTNVTPYTFFYS